MKRRSLFTLAVAATAGIALSACTGESTPPVQTGVSTQKPTATHNSNPNFTNPVDKDRFLADLKKAAPKSYKSVSTTEGAVKGESTMLYEVVDNEVRIHTQTTDEDGETETITIGSDMWVKPARDKPWEKVQGIALGGGGDSIETYSKYLDSVKYVGSSGDGHQFDIVVKMESVEVPVSMWLNNDFVTTKTVSVTEVDGKEVTRTELFSDFGKSWDIKAPI